MTECRLLSVSYVAALGMAMLASPAHAALTARIALEPQATSFGVNQPVAIDVFLRDIRDTNTAAPTTVVGVDLDFGGVATASTPLRFVPTAAAPKAFLASTGFAAQLGLAQDGSLIDGHTAGLADLSFVTAPGVFAGLPSNAADVLVGTLYATATSTGLYTLSANRTATLVQSGNANFDAFALTYTNAAITVVNVPEPASVLGLAGLATATLLRQRRNTHH